MNYSIFLIVGCVLILIGTVVTGPRKLREEMTGSGLICMGLGFLMIIYGLAAPGRMVTSPSRAPSVPWRFSRCMWNGGRGRASTSLGSE
jgi:hypothetical protein